MNETTETTKTTGKAQTTEPTISVHVRLEHKELEQVKDETGATADATAVACFVRKNLRKRG